MSITGRNLKVGLDDLLLLLELELILEGYDR